MFARRMASDGSKGIERLLIPTSTPAIPMLSFGAFSIASSATNRGETRTFPMHSRIRHVALSGLLLPLHIGHRLAHGMGRSHGGGQSGCRDAFRGRSQAHVRGQVPGSLQVRSPKASVSTPAWGRCSTWGFVTRSSAAPRAPGRRTARRPRLRAHPIRAAREKNARSAADALEPKLPKLTIVVLGTETNVRLEVRRDGAVVPSSMWGMSVAVDPGEHTFEASAPGANLGDRRSWRKRVNPSK